MQTKAELINLSWNEFNISTNRTFRGLFGNENFSDVTLACGDGKQLKAHKIILSSCSSFFRNILLQNPHQHPLLYLNSITIEDLTCILQFIYSGEVEISNDNLDKFLCSAKELQIDGLVPQDNENINNKLIESEVKPEIVVNDYEELGEINPEITKKDHIYEDKERPSFIISKIAEHASVQKSQSNKSCDICYKVFTTLWSKDEHVESVHERIKYNCNQCEHLASSKGNIRGHMQKKHPGEDFPFAYTKTKLE